MTTRILVLGGGFAGVSTAQALVKQLRREGRLVRPGRAAKAGDAGRSGVSVTLLARDNHFVFQPLLADVISGAIETTHVVVPLRRMLRDVEVEVGTVEAIDADAREVHVVRRQSGRPFRVGYDALVVALGSVTDFRAVPGMAEHALGVRTLGDAFYLRNRALAMLEEAATEPDPARRRRLL
ncbi:MAG TPA: FAD-dependent oxidoreductase, partial [Euzebyales bacterium]|nr:FAD-dependent oxidoreductase [Euzebyales bacterium]